MKKIFLVFLLSVFSFLSAKDELKVGISPDYPPFEYMENGKITGFDYDVMVALASEIGAKIEFVPMNFDGLLSSLSVGKVDMVISGMTKTKERAKKVDFTIPYYKSVSYFVKLKSNNSIKTKEDLSGKKVAAQIGSIQADSVNKIKGVKPMISQDVMVFVMGTLNGKVDAFLLDEAVAKDYVKKYEDFEIFDKIVYENTGKAIAVKKGNDELVKKLDEAIKKLEQNDTIKNIAQKYNMEY